MVSSLPKVDHVARSPTGVKGAQVFTQTRPSAQELREGAAPVIVVGYDGLEESRSAVTVAAQRAGPKGTLAVVYVIEPVPDWLGTPYRQRALDERHLAAQGSFNKLIGTDFGGTTVETEVVEGQAAEALIRVAQVRHADEIVVGSRRRGRLRAMLGSVSHRLLEQADRPVVVVTDPLTAPEVVRAHAAGATGAAENLSAAEPAAKH